MVCGCGWVLLWRLSFSTRQEISHKYRSASTKIPRAAALDLPSSSLAVAYRAGSRGPAGKHRVLGARSLKARARALPPPVQESRASKSLVAADCMKPMRRRWPGIQARRRLQPAEFQRFATERAVSSQRYHGTIAPPIIPMRPISFQGIGNQTAFLRTEPGGSGGISSRCRMGFTFSVPNGDVNVWVSALPPAPVM
jgi:hypothetical protein